MTKDYLQNKYLELPFSVRHIITKRFSDYKGLVLSSGDRMKDSEIPVIIPRCFKSKEEQKERSKKKAEVFTPIWVVNEQNNLVDNAYLETNNVFSTDGTDFKCVELSWKKCKMTKAEYMKSTRLEITCGEAPYLTSRYDTATGEDIAFENRIGLLDRKLKVAISLKSDRDTAKRYLFDCLKSCYGYEYQADSLIIARLNLLLTCLEYCEITGIKITDMLIFMITNIICGNVIQLDGLKSCEPITEESTYVVNWRDNDEYELVNWKDLEGIVNG